MNIKEAKENLLKKVMTPEGKRILYGINLLPGQDNFGLIFYPEKLQKLYWNTDCKILEKREKRS